LHVHAAAVHVWAAPQWLLHVPQLVLLVDVFTHVLLHCISASGHPVTQLPPVQT
jgi:hypothetical protein